MAIVLDGTNGVTTNSGTLISATTIGVGNATPSTSGAGITFPATQSASTDANTLDDYEEGSFSPTISGSSSAGTATYSAQNGRYTKIGRMVFVEMYISWNSGTGTGNLRLTGLPFTSGSVSTYPSFVISYFDNIAMTANNFPLCYVEPNLTYAVFYQCPTGGGANTAIAYDAAGAVQISGCYTV